MANDWEDDCNFSAPMATSIYDEGRNYGKGRGFMPPKKNGGLSNVGQSQQNSNDDWGNVGKSDDLNGDNVRKRRNNNDDWETGESADVSSSNNNNWDNNTTEEASNYNDWDNTNQQSTNNDDWNTDNNQTQNYDNTDDDNNNRGGGGGGGGGGYRGGRSGRGGRRDRDNNDEGGDRRGRSRTRNTDDGIDDENNNEDGVEKKPPVTYIPPERSMDDNELFGSGIAIGINFNKYDNIKIEVTGDDAPSPINDFANAGLRSSLVTNIQKSGYNKPTPVQKYSIPIIMSGRDVMACAQTGSGKTAAYLIPIIHKLLENNDELRLIDRGCEPQVVVLAPTRELVTQICWEAQKFSNETIIKSVSVYGGVATMHQVRKLEQGAHIIVATPGRLNDFVERGRVKFSAIRFMVLDEADRMLDAGFLPSMESILGHETMVPCAERQTVMFSATLPSDVQNLASRFMRNYLFLRVGIVGGACEDVEQNFYEVEKKQKRRKLEELLNIDGGVSLKKKTLVFVETKKTADFIAAYMSDNQFPSTSIHGDREQREREIALNDFKSGRMSILVATSVAARGLDIPEVAHVINYDLPKSIDEYVHRIGRTGRMGNKGKATSFYDPDHDKALAQDIVRVLMNANKEVPEFLSDIDTGGFDGGKSSGFGGYDIRGGNNDNVQVEPEENW